MTEDRRSYDARFDRIERVQEHQAEQISTLVAAQAAHTATCTEAERRRAADIAEMKANIGKLVQAAERRAGAIWAARAIWGAGVVVVGAIGTAAVFFWEHIRPLLPRAIVLALLSCTAQAAPPEGAPTSGPVYEWFQRPEVRACCSSADCRPHRIRPNGDGWQVLYEGKWLDVPPGAVKQDASPITDTIVCIPPTTGIPLCLFFGGST